MNKNYEISNEVWKTAENLWDNNKGEAFTIFNEIIRKYGNNNDLGREDSERVVGSYIKCMSYYNSIKNFRKSLNLFRDLIHFIRPYLENLDHTKQENIYTGPNYDKTILSSWCEIQSKEISDFWISTPLAYSVELTCILFNIIPEKIRQIMKAVDSWDEWIQRSGKIPKVPRNIESELKKYFSEDTTLEAIRNEYKPDILYDVLKLSFVSHIEDTEEEYIVYERLFIANLQKEINKKISKKVSKRIIEHEVEKAQTRIDERNNILLRVSHSIINLISTITTPLENLKEERKYSEIVIDNALKGAELIRKIVKAMNMSYKGSIKDFEYDVQQCDKKDCITLEGIIIESLKHSVINMFDSKYFSNFMRNYFPNKEIYLKAKNKWNQTTSTEDITKFVKEYMFDFSLDIREAKDLIIGNEKGSAIKFQILFQEAILNAVKYTSFMDIDNRKVNIECKTKQGKIFFKISNTYNKNVVTKTTGLGHIIINNFAKLLETEPEIEVNSMYEITLNFMNIWQSS